MTKATKASPTGGAGMAAAMAAHRAGRAAEAERLYRQVLAETPDHADAHHLVGLLVLQAGRVEEAAASVERAVGLRPGGAAYRVTLAQLRRAQGRVEDAAAAYETALAIDPALADAAIGLGSLRLEEGDLDAAVERFRQATAAAPDHAFAWTLLGGALRDRGAVDEAAKAFERAAALAPQIAEAHFNLAGIRHAQGRLAEAAEGYARAVAIRPDDGEAHCNLASTQRALGRHEEALAGFEEALRLNPDLAQARLGLVEVLKHLRPRRHRDDLDRLIRTCLDSPVVEPQSVAGIAMRQIKLKYAFDPREPDPGHPVLRDPIPRRLLATTVNRDGDMELFLTGVRRRLLLDDDPTGADAADHADLMSALAQQGFNNGYVFWLDEEEEKALAALRAGIEEGLRGAVRPDAGFERRLLRFAMYGPLAALGGAEKLAAIGIETWSAPLRPVMTRTLLEPTEEAEIAAALGEVAPVAEATSAAVRAQYEENPYPRWLALRGGERESLALELRRAFPTLAPPAFLARPVEVLVAGCGTGQHPIRRAGMPGIGHVVAVDLSRRSLAYGARMARRMGVANIAFLHGDILDLGRLDRRFPVIECVGVLHHMADPLAGWRVLADLLEGGGMMLVGLYSERARRDIVAARARIAALDLAPTPASIRAFRRRVLLGEEEAPLADLPRRRSVDFFDASGCRDLLFHVQEHRHGLPEISAALADLGLDFVGFVFQDAEVKRRYGERFPEDPAMTDLALWDSFEKANPDTFAGMYLFWCRKGEG